MTLLSPLLSLVLLWFPPPGAVQDAAPQGLSARLRLVEPYVWRGRPARVRLTLHNGAPEARAISSAALFGDGLVVRRAGPDGVEQVFKVTAAPPEAHSLLLLPSEATLATTVDLTALAPAAMLEPGAVQVTFEGVDSCEPLPIEIWRDYSQLQVVLETDFGNLTLKCFPDKAPRTVKNFFDLVERGFYDGLTFHRVVKGFMIQGGCPIGDGTGFTEPRLPFERSDLIHDRGTVSMARQGDLNSASCQFFLCHQRIPFLDGNYAAFGALVEGLETLDKIAEVECVWAIGGPDAVPSRPKEKVVIRKARVVPAPAPGGP